MMNWDVASEAERGMNCANCSTVFDINSKKAHKFLLSDGDPQKPTLREITILESLSELFNLRSLSLWQCNESGSEKTENTPANSKFLSVRLCASCATLLAQLYKLYFDFNRIRNKSSFLEREIQRNLHTLTLKNKNSDNSDSNSSSCCTNSNYVNKKNDQSKVNNNNNSNNSNLFNNDRDTRTENMRGQQHQQQQIIINNPSKNPVSNIINSYHHHQHHHHHLPTHPSLLNQPQQQQQQHQDRIMNNNINNKATSIIIQDTPKLSYSKPKSLIMSHYNSSNNTTDDDEGPIIVDCKSMSSKDQPNYNPTVPFLLHQALTSRSPSYSPKESKSNNHNESPSIIRTNKIINPILNTQDSTERSSSSNVLGMNLNRGSIVIQTRTVSELEITRITDRITDEISPPPPPSSRSNINNNNNSSTSTSSNQEHWRKRHCNTNLDSKNNKFSKIIIENPPNNDNKTFKCGECRAIFDSFQLLSSHIQLHLPGPDKYYNEALTRKKSTERN